VLLTRIFSIYNNFNLLQVFPDVTLLKVKEPLGIVSTRRDGGLGENGRTRDAEKIRI
jgi:hypothetical protein